MLHISGFIYRMFHISGFYIGMKCFIFHAGFSHVLAKHCLGAGTFPSDRCSSPVVRIVMQGPCCSNPALWGHVDISEPIFYSNCRIRI